MTFTTGDQVRFVRDYHLELPPELDGITDVIRGARGRVIFCDTTFILVELASTHEHVAVWRPGALSQRSATTEVLATETRAA
jgi:hypothetical protein